MNSTSEGTGDRDESPSELVDRMRVSREQNSEALHKETDKWLQIAQIATKAVFQAAAAGNLTCKEAAGKILPLLK